MYLSYSFSSLFFFLLIFSICRPQIETELCNFSPPLCKWRCNMKACDKTENHGILEYICHLAISWFNHSSNIINWPQYSRVDLIFCTRMYAATAADFCWCNDLWITCQISLIVRIFLFLFILIMQCCSILQICYFIYQYIITVNSIPFLCWEWRCSWSSAVRRCSNYIWMINNLIPY